jgi:hypothetical protein
MLQEKEKKENSLTWWRFPSSQFPCLKSTAFMPLALPSTPAAASRQKEHLFTYRQH